MKVEREREESSIDVAIKGNISINCCSLPLHAATLGDWDISPWTSDGGTHGSIVFSKVKDIDEDVVDAGTLNGLVCHLTEKSGTVQ